MPISFASKSNKPPKPPMKPPTKPEILSCIVMSNLPKIDCSFAVSVAVEIPSKIEKMTPIGPSTLPMPLTKPITSVISAKNFNGPARRPLAPFASAAIGAKTLPTALKSSAVLAALATSEIASVAPTAALPCIIAADALPRLPIDSGNAAAALVGIDDLPKSPAAAPLTMLTASLIRLPTTLTKSPTRLLIAEKPLLFFTPARMSLNLSETKPIVRSTTFRKLLNCLPRSSSLKIDLNLAGIDLKKSRMSSNLKNFLNASKPLFSAVLTPFKLSPKILLRDFPKFFKPSKVLGKAFLNKSGIVRKNLKKSPIALGNRLIALNRSLNSTGSFFNSRTSSSRKPPNAFLSAARIPPSAAPIPEPLSFFNRISRIFLMSSEIVSRVLCISEKTFAFSLSVSSLKPRSRDSLASLRFAIAALEAISFSKPLYITPATGANNAGFAPMKADLAPAPKPETELLTLPLMVLPSFSIRDAILVFLFFVIF